jgi:hypothetical protein
MPARNVAAGASLRVGLIDRARGSLVESDKECYEVFCGFDVAREIHHAVALDRGGRCLVDRPLPNDEARLRALLDELAVPWPDPGGGRPAGVDRSVGDRGRACGVTIGYLPGLAMRRIADLYPGEGKTDLFTEPWGIAPGHRPLDQEQPARRGGRKTIAAAVIRNGDTESGHTAPNNPPSFSSLPYGTSAPFGP